MEFILFIPLLLLIIKGIVNVVEWFGGLFTTVKPLKVSAENYQVEFEESIGKDRLGWEQSEFMKQHTIKHQIEVVEISIHNKTGKIVKISWPESEEDRIKLKEMYDRALAKYK